MSLITTGKLPIHIASSDNPSVFQSCPLESATSISVVPWLPPAKTVKFTEFEGPPPGAGFVTTTGKLSAVARSSAVREIVSWVELTYVAMRAIPLNVTAEVEMNPVPLMVKFCGDAPTVRELGERDVMEGTGLATPEPVTVTDTVAEKLPTEAVMMAVPGATSWS
jgi:hypothetical protein